MKREEASNTNATTSNSEKSISTGLSELLEAVLVETRGDENSDSLNLVREVARNSQHEAGDSQEAVVELVTAIFQKRLGLKRAPQTLLKQVVGTLMDSPEAIAKLSRVWREARANG